jgi:hypothetical protein
MENQIYLWLYLTFDIIKEKQSFYSKRLNIEKLLSRLLVRVADVYERILDRS